MDATVLNRLVQGLKTQRESLLAWLSSAPVETKAVRLGDRPPEVVAGHVEVLESAIRKAEKDELGLCTVCHEHVETHWLETNYTTCVCIEHMNSEERAKLEAELELSQKVQKGLLPRAVPDITGGEIAAFSQPASIVGGDYFDFLKFRDGSLALIIADVMGKGMPASMLMASLQATLRIIVPETDSPEEVLERVNRLFCHNINLTKFVTIVVVRLDPATGVIRYANAGHNPPLVIAPSGARPVALRPTGAAIGLVEDAEFTSGTAHVAKGGVLVLYTDGVVEATDSGRDEFGENRLIEHLLGNSRSSASGTIRDLREAIREFTGGGSPSDDTTIVVYRRGD